MKCLVPFILAVILVAAEGKAVPASDVETQQTGTQPSEPTLADRFREAQNIISTLGTQIQERFNLPHQSDLSNQFQDHINGFAKNVTDYIKNMSDEIKTKNPELENLWTNMKTKLSDMVDKIQVNPETTEQVNQLSAKFQEGVQTIVTESENAAKAISENSAKVQEGIAKLTKQAIDIAVQASQNLNDHLHQATTTQP